MTYLVRDVAVLTAAALGVMRLVGDPGGCLLVAAWTMVAVAVVVAVRAVLAPSWGVAVAAGVVLWFAAFAVMFVAAERIPGRAAGEDAMIFLGPTMLLPLVVLVSGAARLVLRRRQRPPALPPV